MKQVKVCFVCGHPNEAGAFICEGSGDDDVMCGTSLADVALSDAKDQERGPDKPENKPEAAQGEPDGGELAHTVRNLPRGAVRIHFDWGEVEVTNGLGVGRDETMCPFAKQIAKRTTVSRRHARIEERLEGGFQVVDLGSTNGTMVNGEAVNGDSPRKIKHGDRLSFSRLLEGTFDTRRR